MPVPSHIPCRGRQHWKQPNGLPGTGCHPLYDSSKVAGLWIGWKNIPSHSTCGSQFGSSKSSSSITSWEALGYMYGA